MRASVIIPNWNGARWLPICLGALRRQTWRGFETVVVDNASTDESVDLMARDFPEVRVLQLPENRFFSGAVNAGIRAASGDVLVLLNNDTEAEPTWLEELLAALDRHPKAGMATSKLRLFDDRRRLHSAGDFFRIDGTPGNRGAWEEDRGQYDAELEVFSACGGACAYRRSMLDRIGLLDEDFFGYCEDVDLAFRAQLAGYRCVFAPKARIYHGVSSTGGGPLASFLCGRNFIYVIVKDMPGGLIRRYWHRILLAQLGHALDSLRHWREPAARARLRGQLAGLLAVPRLLQKRRPIQAGRIVSDEEIERLLAR